MRKLKLQMQLTVDGFVAGPNGEMDWMVWDWDQALKDYVNQLTEPVDCILLGKNLALGFIDAWVSRLSDPGSEDFAFANKMVDTHKVVFSKELENSAWKNTTYARGNIVEEVTRLKEQPGSDIITYGGASFAGSLIKNNLIDEYHLFINPAAIGKGMAIFNKLEGKFPLKLVKATQFECGINVLVYEPNR